MRSFSECQILVIIDFIGRFWRVVIQYVGGWDVEVPAVTLNDPTVTRLG